jgi:hypothetical protein
MNNHIFTNQASVSGLYYSLSGEEDFLDEDNNPRIHNENDNRVVAKALRNKKPKHFNDNTLHLRYYIKTNPNLEIFNPIQNHSSIKDKKLFSHVHSVCKTPWNFKEVDKHIFDQYIQFLKHKNQQSLKEIERQIK